MSLLQDHLTIRGFQILWNRISSKVSLLFYLLISFIPTIFLLSKLVFHVILQISNHVLEHFSIFHFRVTFVQDIAFSVTWESGTRSFHNWRINSLIILPLIHYCTCWVRKFILVLGTVLLHFPCSLSLSLSHTHTHQVFLCGFTPTLV